MRRPSLVDRLARDHSRPIVSVIAPPGYGKTTLLSEWAERSGQAFAWVSVGEMDDDPKVLLTYIAAALDAVEPVSGRVFDALASPVSSVPGSVVPRLGSAFWSMTVPVVLVLDDVHLLHNHDCRAALSVLADHVPAGSRLVLAGRDEPPLRIARLRAEGRIQVEALLGTDRPYDERVQVIRPHPGQLVSAANLRGLLAGSPLLASHRHSRHAVQDAYCLRCAPQVHGAVRDVLTFARQVLTTELGAVVDNPVIVPDGEVMTTGNFHGEPLAFAADMLAMAVSELASISERRVDRMLDPAFSRGLPPFLAPAAGTNSGFMLAQYTAASLVSENKVLAHPASVDTIPTSGKQEDHVSMGWTSVRKLREVIGNVRVCLAVEICCATQGIDLRASVAEPSIPLRAVHDLVRASVPRMDIDREVAAQLASVNDLLPEICRVAAENSPAFR